jgi:3-deoxy-D-manno-octulosonate 8-phosphate phosphatase (KDO 8-P phosphatase)
MKLDKITTIFLDIDGTLTDGKVYLDNGKNELKSFDVKDGLMVVSTIELGYDIIIMTGRQSQVVARRAEELGIKELYQGIRNKKETVEKLMEEKEFSYENLAYLGDDLNDFAVMDKCAFAACPADAAAEIKEISDFISEYKGGNGAVREILTYILKEKGEYDKVLALFK